MKYDRLFTPAEQDAARKKGHNDTATGPDDIPNEIYKLVIGVKASTFLLENLNRAFDGMIRVTEWSDGIMIFIYKKKDPRFAKHYPGLTLTNHDGKEVERMIYLRLLEFCAEVNCLLPTEFAFIAPWPRNLGRHLH